MAWNGKARNGKARSCNGIVLRRKELQRQSIEQQRVAEAKQGLVTQCKGKAEQSIDKRRRGVASR